MSELIDSNDELEGGLDRRQMIKRAALVGGALVWATPVVQSIGGTAFATVGSPGGGFPPGTGLSDVTFLINCGGTYTWVKFNPQGAPAGTLANSQCGDIQVPESKAGGSGTVADTVCGHAQTAFDDFLADKTVSTDCSGNTATVNAAGSLCFGFAGCDLVGYTIHDGSIDTKCFYTLNGSSEGSTDAFNVATGAGSICVSKK